MKNNIKIQAREMFDERFKCIQSDCDSTGCIPVAKEVPRHISDNPDEYAIYVEWEAEQCKFHAEYIFPIKDFIDQIIDLAIAERDKEIVEMIEKHDWECFEQRFIKKDIINFINTK